MFITCVLYNVSQLTKVIIDKYEENYKHFTKLYSLVHKKSIKNSMGFPVNKMLYPW